MISKLERGIHWAYARLMGLTWGSCPYPGCGRGYGAHERGKARTQISDNPPVYRSVCNLHDHLANPFLRTRASDLHK